MGFNSAFKGLILFTVIKTLRSQNHTKTSNIANGKNAELLSSKTAGTYRYHCTGLYGLLLLQGRVRSVQVCFSYRVVLGVANL